MIDDFDELTALEDGKATLPVGSFNVEGSVFVVPLDAPLPSEISADGLPTGSLYKRLAPLDVEKPTGFAFVPISGAELLSLDRVWRQIQAAKRVFVLTDLPAARYDVLFTQAVRQIGLASVSWVNVAEAISSRQVTDQRTKDKTPWVNPMVDGVEQPPTRSRGPISSSRSSNALPIPEASDEDQT